MSDAKGSSGAFEDLETAHQFVSWEARLAMARKQRAKVLAEASDATGDEAEPDSVLEEQNNEEPGMSPETKEEQTRSPRLHPDSHVSQGVPQRKFNLGLIVLAALLCGAFLGWGSSRISEEWQQVHAMPVPKEAASPTPAAREVSEPADIASAPSNLAYSQESLDGGLGLSWGLVPPSHYISFGSPNPLPMPRFGEGSDAILQPAPAAPVVPVYAEIKPLPASESASTIEVSLFVPARVSAETSDRALDVLNGGQATVVATARVGFTVKETQVRYYHPDDAEKAMFAAGALNGVPRDFTNSASKTRPGRIEVYLAGQGGSSGQKRARNKPNQFDEFINRLLDELR